MTNLRLNPAKTALLSMDFHRHIVRHVYRAPGHDAVASAKQVLDAARQRGMTVIHVGLLRRPGFVSTRSKFSRTIRTKVPAPPPGQEADAMRIVDAVTPVGDEPVVHKPRINAFFGSDLEWLLRVKDVDTLLLMGVTTDFVVESTARYAADADYRVIVLEDCCAAFSAASHKASIALLDHLADVATAADFLESPH
jgi:nicotinamidase-related amidase